MHTVPLVLILLTAVSLLAEAARRVRLPYPAVMVVGGLLIGVTPGLPHVELSPEIFFTLFLPPLLYSAAWQTSWRDFRANLRSISLLAIGFVAVTTISIAWAAHGLIDGMTWPAALALGAIVSPPDAVAATAIVGRLGVPRRIVTILEGESLVNDASGLALYRIAVAVALTGNFSAGSASAAALWTVVGGIGMGLGVGWFVTRVHRFVDDATVETVLTLVTPYAAFLAAEAAHASGVLAVVAMGLYVSRRAHQLFSADTRLHSIHTWDVVVFVLNGLVFVLVGLQWPMVLEQVRVAGESVPRLAALAAGMCVLMVVVRMAWVFPAVYLPWLLWPGQCRRDPPPPWRNVFMVAYTGMRGATSLAAALALPLTVADGSAFPRRDLILFLTFAAIFGTLVLQSLSLPWLVRRLELAGDNDEEAQCEEWDARLRAARAALGHITSMESTAVDGHRATLRRLRTQYQERVERLGLAEVDEAAGRCATADGVEADVLRAVLSTEREAVVALRDTGRIGDEVRRRIEHDLDLEESRIVSMQERLGRAMA